MTTETDTSATDRRPQAVQVEPIPEHVLARCTFTPDYVDLFTLDRGAEGRTPEWWAREMFTRVLGRDAQFVWRGLMGLKLRQAEDRIAGWAVAGQGDDWLRMAAAGRWYTVELVVLAGPTPVSLATFIRYDGWLGARSWPILSRTHRDAAPDLLLKAYTAAKAT